MWTTTAADAENPERCDTDGWKWLRERRNGEGGGWTTTNVPHYKTLNPPVYSGNGRHCERSENGLGYRQRRQTFTGWRLGEYWSDRRPRRDKGNRLVYVAYFSELLKKNKKPIVNFADERAAAIFVAG